MTKRLLERAVPGRLWAFNWPWASNPSGEQLPRRPAHGHACNVAGQAEEPVMVVAVEVHDSQTAKEAFGSDALADGVGDADATHAAGKTVVGASKSLKQFFTEGPNFAAIEQSGQDQGRVHLTLNLFREALITKEVFHSSESRRSRYNALVDVGIRGESNG